MRRGNKGGDVYDNESKEISLILIKSIMLVTQNYWATYRPVVPRLPTRASLRQ